MILLVPEISVHIFSYISLFQEQAQAIECVCKDWHKIIKYFYFQKPRTLNMVFSGAQGSGKTSTLGYLLQQKGYTTLRQVPFEDYPSNAARKEAATENELNFYDTFAVPSLDIHAEERQKQMTIHPKRIATGVNSNRQRSIVFIDTPGAKSQGKNAIRAIATGDLFFMFLSFEREAANVSADESKKQILNEIRHQIFLALSYGVPDVVVVINKLDNVDYSEEKFKELSSTVEGVFKKCGAKPVAIIPICSINNINILGASDRDSSLFDTDQNVPDEMQFVTQATSTPLAECKPMPMSWYKGPTLNDMINALDYKHRINSWTDVMNLAMNYDISQDGVAQLKTTVTGKKPSSVLLHYNSLMEQPLRLTVHKVFSKGIGTLGVVAQGQVVTGTLKLNMPVIIEPSGIETQVVSLQLNKTAVDTAYPGEYVSLVLKGCSQKELYRGCLVADATRQVPMQAKSFLAKIHTVFPSSHKKLLVGYEPLVFFHATYAAARITAIPGIVDKKSKDDKIISANPTRIDKGDMALVKFDVICPKQPLAIESFHEFNKLGRFVIKDSKSDIVALGIVRSIEMVTKMRVKAPSSISLQPQQQQQQKVVKKVKESPEAIKLREATSKIWSNIVFNSSKWNTMQ